MRKLGFGLSTKLDHHAVHAAPERRRLMRATANPSKAKGWRLAALFIVFALAAVGVLAVSHL